MSKTLIGMTSDGRARYKFEIRFDRKRYRERIVCPKSVANDLYNQWVKDIYNDKIQGKQKFFDILDEYLIWSKVHKSARMHEHEVRHVRFFKEFFGNVSIQEIDRPLVQDCRGHRVQQGVKPATVNRTFSTLSFIFNWAKEREIVSTNPVWKVKLKEENVRVVCLSLEQIKEMIDKSDPYQKELVLLAILTGMRRGEILSLRWKNVNFQARLIQLEGANTKNGLNREIPMPDALVSMLQRKCSQELDSDHVINYRGNPISSINTTWNSLRKRLSFSKELGLRFHDLRHVYATMLLLNGTSIERIKYLLGHRNITTTQRYAHFTGVGDRAWVGNVTTYLSQVI